LKEEPVKDERLFWGVMSKSDDKCTQLRVMPPLASICTVTPEMRSIAFYEELKKSYVEEHKRLMYVGMTRSKEQLILAIESKNKPEWFDSIGYKFPEMNGNDFEWAGKKWKYESCEMSEDSDVKSGASEGDVKLKALKSEERKEYALKNIAPSMVGKSDKVKGVARLGRFGERLNLIANDDKDSTIGNFIHHLMYLWRDDDNISSVAENLAKEYGVSVCVDKMLSMIRGFWQYLEKEYGKPTEILREVPFTLHMDDGRVANGEIDLIYRTETGDVLVDYKTYQGAVPHLTEEGHKIFADQLFDYLTI
jgi:ATP-dependent exoDNAse (exonuclease V) beta subunit